MPNQREKKMCHVGTVLNIDAIYQLYFDWCVLVIFALDPIYSTPNRGKFMQIPLDYCTTIVVVRENSYYNWVGFPLMGEGFELVYAMKVETRNQIPIDKNLSIAMFNP